VTLTASGLFKKVSFNPADVSASDYTLIVDTYNHANLTAASLGGVITGLTLYLVPSKATDNFTEILTLKDKTGVEVWTTKNKDSMSMWQGVWFLPWMGNTPDKILNQTLENQLQTALVDLAKSGKLK